MYENNLVFDNNFMSGSTTVGRFTLFANPVKRSVG